MDSVFRCNPQLHIQPHVSPHVLMSIRTAEPCTSHTARMPQANQHGMWRSLWHIVMDTTRRRVTKLLSRALFSSTTSVEGPVSSVLISYLTRVRVRVRVRVRDSSLMSSPYSCYHPQRPKCSQDSAPTPTCGHRRHRAPCPLFDSIPRPWKDGRQLNREERAKDQQRGDGDQDARTHNLQSGI